MKFLLFILFPFLVFSKELETCYRVYFWFFPVAESCVDYTLKGEELKIRSWAKTVVVGRLVKRVNSWGEATLQALKPKKFALFQREGSFIRDHLYDFLKRGVRYRIVRHKREEKKVKEGFLESSVYLFDPFSTSFLVYIDTPNYKGGTINVFYDAKIQNVHYRTLSEDKVEISGKTYSTWKVLLVPEIETKGILKPKGKWFVWVDKETNIPVKLSIKFTIGSADVVLERVEGDMSLFKEVRNGQIELLQGDAQ
ncbi:DUF3108 domain-containing protein [Hydrogenivirga sp. 128-5-R1-1]|uniref:DUF3108 domain-containing protein n=1 Tax=Hydrogenivirga sp. 128-5-R1-1 TaxID=392423 RepID=UPI00015F0CCE|nr:DUF3108 domain-containing protein [Hydrogenivirga sp. 128-5-R1-1]EDP75898.1 hypothetical protein HG1285_06215 [Hydrogenivirga sp. 128-5-R1-1]